MNAIHFLQAFSGLLWLVPAILHLGDVRRVAFGSVVSHDIRGGFGFFYAILQFGFSLRWWLWPAAISVMDPMQLIVWGSLYLLSALLAVCYSVITIRGRQ